MLNTLKVSIPLWFDSYRLSAGATAGGLSRLNSTMVRFIPRLSFWEGVSTTSSQFHYGSIHTKPFIKMFWTYAASQFHYGSIHTKFNNFFTKGRSLSQFHYGSIHTPAEADSLSVFMPRLNSTMVRFIQVHPSRCGQLERSLNSTMVRFIHVQNNI